MKRSDSLKRKKEFRYTYRAGKSHAGKLCALVTAKNRTARAQIGFSVSKKIGNSVTRNRVKRRMREAVTPLIPAMRPGYNYIFIAREAIVNAPFADIFSAMDLLLTRAERKREEASS